MKKFIPSKNLKGRFYFVKRLLRFQSAQNVISDEDIIHLFLGFVRMLKNSTEEKLEKKYQHKINNLKREINYLRQIKNVN